MVVGMDDNARSKVFAVTMMVVFATAVVLMVGPCIMLLDLGLDQPEESQHRLPLVFVLWAAAEVLLTPFLIGHCLRESGIPKGWWLAAFVSGMALIAGGMLTIAVTFGERITWLDSPWPLVVTGSLGIIVGTRLSRLAMRRRQGSRRPSDSPT